MMQTRCNLTSAERQATDSLVCRALCTVCDQAAPSTMSIGLKCVESRVQTLVLRKALGYGKSRLVWRASDPSPGRLLYRNWSAADLDFPPTHPRVGPRCSGLHPSNKASSTFGDGWIVQNWGRCPSGALQNLEFRKHCYCTVLVWPRNKIGIIVRPRTVRTSLQGIHITKR